MGAKAKLLLPEVPPGEEEEEEEDKRWGSGIWGLAGGQMMEERNRVLIVEAFKSGEWAWHCPPLLLRRLSRIAHGEATGSEGGGRNSLLVCTDGSCARAL